MDSGESNSASPKEHKGSTKARLKESTLKQKSPAEFFAENKNIAGFDNPGKSLYTTVRELVENALDSAESVSELPDIEITIEEISKSKFNHMIGLVDHERVDEELYDDFESAKAREKRLAKEAHEQEVQAKNISLGKKTKETPALKITKGRVEASFFRVTCKDNGKGMPHEDIPNMFGRVLSGTKYGLKQTRGKFGLGAKMVTFAFVLIIFPVFLANTLLNVPYVHVRDKLDNKEKWHGAEIQVIIEGNWTTYRSKILQYMRQMAVITPYGQFLFRFISDIADKNITVRFSRRTDVMPPVPSETKHHPSAVDLLLIKRLIAETSKPNLLQFLQYEFVNISKSHADRLIASSCYQYCSSFVSHPLLFCAMLANTFFNDFSQCLSPAGEYNLRLGIIKELHPDMVATYASSWNSYKINQAQDKIGVFVSIVSTKIPFKGTGKEYIGDDIDEIASAVKASIKQCCLQLKSKIVKKIQARERQERKRNLFRYIPDVSRAIYEVLERMATDRVGDQKHERTEKGKKKRLRGEDEQSQNVDPRQQYYEYEDADILHKVLMKEISQATLREKLSEHVEKVDYEMVLEYAAQSGVSEEAHEPVYLPALDHVGPFATLHSPLFVFRLLV
ncbi:unnamed protein product [Victoria cruziana]